MSRHCASACCTGTEHRQQADASGARMAGRCGATGEAHPSAPAEPGGGAAHRRPVRGAGCADRRGAGGAAQPGQPADLHPLQPRLAVSHPAGVAAPAAGVGQRRVNLRRACPGGAGACLPVPGAALHAGDRVGSPSRSPAPPRRRSRKSVGWYGDYDIAAPIIGCATVS